MAHQSKKSVIRQEVRARRRAFQGIGRRDAERDICHFIREHPRVQKAQFVAAYFPFDGEVNLGGLWGKGQPIHQWEQSKTPHFVFPVHERGHPLRFISPERWTRQGPLALPIGEEIALSQIDVILVPGVAFCPDHGTRLGLGGGYYDRTLALRVDSSWSAVAFGVGFAMQRYSPLPMERWDIPLDGLFTELGLSIPRYHDS